MDQGTVCDPASQEPGEIREAVEESFPGYTANPRNRLLLYRDYVELFLEGEKETTVRFEEGKLDVPGRERMPLIVSFPDSDEEVSIGNVKLTGMEVKPFQELTEEDARRDGFRSLEELREGLEEIYGEIPAGHPVTIYTIESAEPLFKVKDAFSQRVDN